MKITEITNVVRHPAMKRKDAFDNLLMSQDQDDLIEFIMDDNNSQSRRLALLKRLDIIMGGARDSYQPSDLDDFMHDASEINADMEEIMARDMKLPPYHLSLVDEETPDDEIPTGEYEICQRCGGAGCIECEEGLKDITGVHKVLDLDDFKGE